MVFRRFWAKKWGVWGVFFGRFSLKSRGIFRKMGSGGGSKNGQKWAKNEGFGG